MEKQVFGNRYQVTEKVGMGGMAEVFKAVDSTLGRTVAIKVMLPQYASDRTFTARFRQEAQAAANLNSPYIVNIYDWGKDGDSYYIVMEYVRGTDLKTAIQNRGAIHPRKVAEIGSQVCSALSVAHGYGVIHRDIKSANIMVQTDGNVKVMDFGIAQAGNADMTQDSSVLGTAHYVSPEQAQGKQLTGASDLYSLGIVLYEAATGQLPFDGPDAVSVAMKQVSDQPVPPSEINPNIPAALEEIILRALSKDLNWRYENASEMKKALDDFLAGRFVSAGAATTVLGAGAYEAAKTKAMPTVQNGKGALSNTYDDEDEKKKGGKGKFIAIAVVIILLLGAIGGFVACSGTFAEKVIVPDVTGMTVEQATTELESYGFKVGNITYKASDSVENGKVIAQDPKANDSASDGAKINLTVSSGPEAPEKVTVPDLSGMTASEASNALTKAGLKGQATEEYSDDVDKGKVFGQDPAAKSEVDEGSTVTYKVSKGVRMTTVPDVMDLTQEDAKTQLEKNGLNMVIAGTEETNDQSLDGKISYQSPKANSSTEYGSGVSVKVYKYVAPADQGGSSSGGSSDSSSSNKS